MERISTSPTDVTDIIGTDLLSLGEFLGYYLVGSIKADGEYSLL